MIRVIEFNLLVPAVDMIVVAPAVLMIVINRRRPRYMSRARVHQPFTININITTPCLFLAEPVIQPTHVQVQRRRDWWWFWRIDDGRLLLGRQLRFESASGERSDGPLRIDGRCCVWTAGDRK